MRESVIIFAFNLIRKSMPRFKFLSKIVSTAAVCLILGACAAAYRIDIQQGNLITDKQIAQLEPGMTKREVRYVLGTPLVVDPFHENRWDYFYSLDARGQDLVQRRVTIVFENDLMDRIEGDIADNTEATGEEDEGGTVVTESQVEEKGFFSRTWDKVWDRDDDVY